VTERPVHCLTQVAADVPAGDEWLAPEERARLASLGVVKRREEWRLGRWTAKRLLAACLPGGPALAAIVVRAAADGAPEAVVGGAPAGWTLSLSHRAGTALCAAAPGRVALGCDVELIEPRSAAFVEDYLVASERDVLRAAPAEERALLANLIWSAKESALKALRVGLRADTRAAVVEPFGGPAADGWRPLVVRCAGRALRGWWQTRGALVLTVVGGAADGPPRQAPGGTSESPRCRASSTSADARRSASRRTRSACSSASRSSRSAAARAARRAAGFVVRSTRESARDRASRRSRAASESASTRMAAARASASATSRAASA
jgi:4'-phosphopantetheinyl transferase